MYKSNMEQDILMVLYTEEQLKELAAEAFAKETGMPAEQIKGYIDTMSKDELIGAYVPFLSYTQTQN